MLSCLLYLCSKHLVLHFDINKTMIIMDPVSKVATANDVCVSVLLFTHLLLVSHNPDVHGQHDKFSLVRGRVGQRR